MTVRYPEHLSLSFDSPIMTYQFFATDSSFYNTLGEYTLETRCEILADLGFTGTYLTLIRPSGWEYLPKIAGIKERYGLEIVSVYATLDISSDSNSVAELSELLANLEGSKRVDLAIVSGDGRFAHSDESADALVVSQLKILLDLAQRRGIQINLYPHSTHWLERMSDGVRLCRILSSLGLGLVFTGYHWYAMEKGAGLREQLEEAAPFLRSALLSGCRRTGNLPDMAPLDEGDLDNFAILGELKRIGFQGPIGFMGYYLGGDVYGKLKRTLASYLDMEKRLRDHPEWGALRLRPRQANGE